METAEQYAEIREAAYRMIEHAVAVGVAGKYASMVKPLDVAEPMRRWVGQLFETERALAIAPEIARGLKADTAHGLRALEAARQRFWAMHKKCPQCGRVLLRAVKRCACGEKV